MIEPGPRAFGVRSLHHHATREVPICDSYVSCLWVTHMYYLYVLVCVVLPVQYLCHLGSCYLSVTCG